VVSYIRIKRYPAIAELVHFQFALYLFSVTAAMQLFWKSKIEENTSIPCLLFILRLSVRLIVVMEWFTCKVT